MAHKQKNPDRNMQWQTCEAHAVLLLLVKSHVLVWPHVLCLSAEGLKGVIPLQLL